ncbi:MAG TPA: DUF3179 domain-containing (seleno)protein [Planctomycetaceae bacterium]|jgi:hypothetical protein|nr:DUF3179 domain-containing (seleno)protein [Planctomycetaceae bacterium]
MVSMVRMGFALAVLGIMAAPIRADVPGNEIGRKLILRPGLFTPLHEPPCSYCSTEHRKGLIRDDDLVLAWIRGAHNGGAVSVRHFLAGPRVVNDTYGLFFYDPDGGYVAAYTKDYDYKFHGWRGGVMVVKGADGTLWSALTGIAFEGPQTGKRLTRLPSTTTNWGYWRMLHPESTAYNLFDGKKYPVIELLYGVSQDVAASLGRVDPRMPKDRPVLGLEVGDETKAYPLDLDVERACFTDEVGRRPIAVFWYGPTRSAVAFATMLNGQKLTFYADNSSPETAPFKDKETGTRWTIAGRGVDGRLRGKELTWVPSIQCRWYAWSGEYPQTALYEGRK